MAKKPTRHWGEGEIETPLLTVGVVSDTHIPDRVSAIPDELLDRLNEMQVDLILHAGDISVPAVIEELGQIAPVTAVRGNRDFFFDHKMDRDVTLDLTGISVVLTHGHGGWVNYLADKLKHIFYGYSFERYRSWLSHQYPHARVIVFGHTHFAENRWVDGKLFFNPGSCTMAFRNQKPSFGMLRFYERGRITGEIHRLQKGVEG